MSRLIPGTFIGTAAHDVEKVRELLLAFLKKHGPATDDQIDAWIRLRTAHEMQEAVIWLFEAGEVDVEYPGPDDDNYVIRLVDPDERLARQRLVQDG